MTAFLPELVLSLGSLALFVVTLGEGRTALARGVAMGVALAALAAAVVSLDQRVLLFDGAYQVDLFSQFLKLILAAGLVLVLLVSAQLPDIREDVRPEYFLFLLLSLCGLTMLVSSVELITLVVALELAAFPLYPMLPLRREREGQRVQMESAIKYIMFGVAANGVMLFGMSYLYGLGGTTSLAGLAPALRPLAGSPILIAALVLTCCGLFYKLALFPFHFWTPDVYQGAAHETAGLIATLPKVGAVAVLVRVVSLAAPQAEALALLFSVLALASMFYGNLLALRQQDFKRLLGFSAIAHAGYALIGFVALDPAGYAAALYYLSGYVLMALACFAVIFLVAREGVNVQIEDLAGLHRRSPLLALTLLTGAFALAGIPPFVGFMGKFALLKAALAKGHLYLVVLAVLNAAIAVYYYLRVVREACFREVEAAAPIALSWPSRLLCLLLIAGILGLGLAPGPVLDLLSTSLRP
jgi:NADH-quinone oxidoreductase subunit N